MHATSAFDLSLLFIGTFTRPKHGGTQRLKVKYFTQHDLAQVGGVAPCPVGQLEVNTIPRDGEADLRDAEVDPT